MLMRIRRKNSRFSIILAIAFGVGSGIYIWKPYLEEQKSKLDLEQITKDEINTPSRWETYKVLWKQKFTFKAFLVIAALAGAVAFKIKIYPQFKRRKLEKTHEMMSQLYEVEKKRETEENWRLS